MGVEFVVQWVVILLMNGLHGSFTICSNEHPIPRNRLKNLKKCDL